MYAQVHNSPSIQAILVSLRRGFFPTQPQALRRADGGREQGGREVIERTWPMVLTSANHLYGSGTSVCTTTVCSTLRSSPSTARVNNPERAGEASGGRTVQSYRQWAAWLGGGMQQCWEVGAGGMRRALTLVRFGA